MEPEDMKPPPPPQITLRPFTLSDADVDAFMSWAADDRAMQFFGPTYATKDAAAVHIRSNIISHPWYRAICVGSRTDRPVGWIFINLVFGDNDDSAHRATMGYGLTHEWWGRGIMTAAVRTAVATVFAERSRLERLEALTATENRRSQRVLEKVGFKREGVLRKYAVLMGESRDVVMFSFLDTDTISADESDESGQNKFKWYWWAPWKIRNKVIFQQCSTDLNSAVSWVLAGLRES